MVDVDKFGFFLRLPIDFSIHKIRRKTEIYRETYNYICR